MAGGASSGMFGFPTTALEHPSFVKEEQWELLKDKSASAEDVAAAVVSMVKQAVAKQNAGIWALLDELISVDRSTLIIGLSVILSILGLGSCFMTYREVARGDMTMALVHSGFLVILFCLVGTIVWVVSMADEMEAQIRRREEERMTSPA